MKITFTLFAALSVLWVAASGCSGSNDAWPAREKSLILDGNGAMRVTLVTDPEDLELLRTPSSDIPVDLLGGELYRRLSERMVTTVTEEDGVGIAGPQVGLLRRVVAVQRFDKEGEPFEVYPNIRIVAARGEKEAGPEGCLSVPDRRGDVLRWRDIDIAYTSPATLSDTLETVTGFPAVIFQHECDHLDGVVFTDRL